MNVFALLLILLASPVAASPSPGPAHAYVEPAVGPVAPEALLSRRALRQARLIIQMRMLQFHEERLECIRAALLRQLPPALRPVEPTTWSASFNASQACLLHP